MNKLDEDYFDCEWDSDIELASLKAEDLAELLLGMSLFVSEHYEHKSVDTVHIHYEDDMRTWIGTIFYKEIVR